MSDDKRKKLREYLRNNRPKNRANLGNNSNNKENSNKNLEKDLNLDNSQISHNKTNSNKRDYDKDPLIIKNLKYKLNYLSSVLCLILTSFFTIIAIIFDLVPIQKIIFNDFIAFIVLYPAFTDGKNSVDGYFKFENSTITSFGFFLKKR